MEIAQEKNSRLHIFSPPGNISRSNLIPRVSLRFRFIPRVAPWFALLRLATKKPVVPKGCDLRRHPEWVIPLVLNGIGGGNVHKHNWGELTHKNDSWDEPPSRYQLLSYWLLYNIITHKDPCMVYMLTFGLMVNVTIYGIHGSYGLFIIDDWYQLLLTII